MIDFAGVSSALPIPFPFGILILAVCLIALIVGSILDIKTREVPDWMNYSLIFFGLGFHLIYSLVTGDWKFMLGGLVGFGIFAALAFMMFYAGQWGGGDSKLLMGMGAIIGAELSMQRAPFLLVFVVYTLVIGSFYGLVWSIIMAIVHRRAFYEELKKMLLNKTARIIRILLLCFAVVMLVWSFFVKDPLMRMLIISIFIFMFLFFYVWVFVKAVEKVCMLKQVNPEELTEGDWIAKDVIIDGKYITGPRDLGIEKKNIRKLIALKKQHKVKKILIKVGIPFVPSFLIAFVLALLSGGIFAALWPLLG